MIDLYYVQPHKVQAFIPTLYENVLNAEEKKQVDKQRVVSVRHQRILSRAILRLILSQIKQTNAQRISLRTTEYGKPYLPNSNLHFNVSHTQNMLVIATSTTSEVGIDIEYPSIQLHASSMPQQCFHPQEWEHFQSLPEQTKQVFFLKMWTKKEAITKALGLGFHLPFQSINTINNQDTYQLHNKVIHQYTLPAPQTHTVAALASVSNQAIPIKPWQELQPQWINQCLT